MSEGASHTVALNLTVNGRPWSGTVPMRRSLADFLRDNLGLTGTHLGCEHGVCGACSVMVDGAPQRSCLNLAAAMEGCEITTTEGLAGKEVDALRRAFSARHALQCGFCTPGMLATALDIIARGKTRSEAEVREELSGNLCRCTGYQGIVAAILDASKELNHGKD